MFVLINQVDYVWKSIFYNPIIFLLNKISSTKYTIISLQYFFSWLLYAISINMAWNRMRILTIYNSRFRRCFWWRNLMITTFLINGRFLVFIIQTVIICVWYIGIKVLILIALKNI